MPFNMKIPFTVQVDLEDIVDQATSSSVDRDEIVEMIKEIDRRMEDWDFTLELCEHFAGLKREWEKEQMNELMPQKEPG